MLHRHSNPADNGQSVDSPQMLKSQSISDVHLPQSQNYLGTGKYYKYSLLIELHLPHLLEKTFIVKVLFKKKTRSDQGSISPAPP